ncbi:transposase [Clostridium estertheticum]|nr:Tn3 family transposase [Clostridium estertheticum]MBU3217719.1 transposase [Clostridium estertheticum]
MEIQEQNYFRAEILTKASSKYFGRGRGVNYSNFVSDQFTGFHEIVIPGTLRYSMYLIEEILEI